MINKFNSAALAAIAFVAMAACATTEEQPVEVVEEVQPIQQEVPTGPVPGSAEDLEENVGHRVFFGYDQYNLTNEAQATLARQAAWLKEYPGTRIRIVGSADERGTREYNLALGARRATSAKAFLVGLGVDAARISTMSVGKERPIDPRSNPEAWAKNRNATSVLVTTGA